MRKLALLVVLSIFFFPSFVLAEEVVNVGQIIAEEVPFYNVDGEQVGLLKMNGRNLPFQDSTTSQRAMISVGGVNAFIDRQFIQQVSIEVPSVNTNSIGTIKTVSPFSVFTATSRDSTVLVTANSPLTLNVQSLKNGYYEVDIAGQIGYIPPEMANPVFSSNDLYFTVMSDSVPYYEMKNNQLVKKGTFASGTSWTRIKSSNGKHVVKFGERIVYVPEFGTFSTAKKPVVKGPAKAKFPIKVLPEKEIDVLGVDGVKIGSISRGSFVDIYGLVKEKAVINFFGQEGRVDFSQFVHTNLLSPKKNVSHEEMSYLVQVFAAMYPEFTKLEQIGKSVEGRPIYAIRLGNGKKEVLFDASMHAREHMSTNVVLEMLDTYSYHYLNKTKYAGYNVKSTLDAVSIWFIPMMNPDGVTLVQAGAKAVKNGALATKINGSSNFARWKANVRGVDLNDNFDTGWKYNSPNVKKPSFMGYRGPRAFSEPESVALRDFVLKHSFKTYISYHSSGQIIYWFQWQKGAQATRDLTLARSVSRITGYNVVPPMYLQGTGASTDWFIDQKKMPSLTIEISPYVSNRPVPLAYWDRIWKQNQKIGLFIAQDASKR
ncbi:M14 family zinc carboxypeptidase [Paenisporosarcina indica]|uniref:M14 family zinc carboxypeptidase n=1 Tax=Paenisporosarcina indica TaxID=650093 RepID=UPI00094F5A32|nr:M14 family zinc carboxypeptidase [Paenisporosarcina indica]